MKILFPFRVDVHKQRQVMVTAAEEVANVTACFALLSYDWNTNQRVYACVRACMCVCIYMNTEVNNINYTHICVQLFVLT
jgi:hypothetical protein